jgi:hypothetical protein
MLKHLESNVAELKKDEDKKAEMRPTMDVIDWLLAIDFRPPLRSSRQATR